MTVLHFLIVIGIGSEFSAKILYPHPQVIKNMGLISEAKERYLEIIGKGLFDNNSFFADKPRRGGEDSMSYFVSEATEKRIEAGLGVKREDVMHFVEEGRKKEFSGIPGCEDGHHCLPDFSGGVEHGPRVEGIPSI